MILIIDTNNLVNHIFLLTHLDNWSTPIWILTIKDYIVMKKVNKINPIAKLLPKFGKRIVEDKRNKQKEKQSKKDIEDGKTFQDS
jgi:hypothetical protein